MSERRGLDNSLKNRASFDCVFEVDGMHTS
jgi:hypothetical protein